MKVTRTKDVKLPTRGTELSAGLDFYVPNDFKSSRVFPGKGINIPSGVHVKVPKGYALIAMNKSGISLNKGLQVGACVVDEDYQGEIHLHVRNINTHSVLIQPGLKLVQFLLIPVSYDGIQEVSSLESLYGDQKTERGTGGFGSTGAE